MSRWTRSSGPDLIKHALLALVTVLIVHLSYGPVVALSGPTEANAVSDCMDLACAGLNSCVYNFGTICCPGVPPYEECTMGLCGIGCEPPEG